MSMRFSRRRTLSVLAAAAGLALTPAALRAAPAPMLHRWQGIALGADATILLAHPDGNAARRLLAACVDEIARLEAIFSLYDRHSATVQLNRQGELAAPPLDLVRLLSECRAVWSLTDGAFDPTVQPLWELYARHFAVPGADSGGPASDAIKSARATVGFGGVRFDAERIVFSKTGMAVTFNGIAQGFITDAVADLLRDGGMDSVLVSLGETRALGRHPDGRPWAVGITDPDHPDEISRTLAIDNRAVATSGGYGTRFAPGSPCNHLFDPATGGFASATKAVTVVAPRAKTADALSTALSVMPIERARCVIEAFDGCGAWVTRSDGQVLRIGTRVMEST